MNVATIGRLAVPILFIHAARRNDYNTVRPHTALANLRPAAYRANQIEQLRPALNG